MLEDYSKRKRLSELGVRFDIRDLSSYEIEYLTHIGAEIDRQADLKSKRRRPK